jgi:hypothetical protein
MKRELHYVPFWKNIDNLLPHYQRRVAKNARWPNAVLRDGNLSVEDGFREEKEPSFYRELHQSQHNGSLTCIFTGSQVFET